jgi:hypothetical protein
MDGAGRHGRREAAKRPLCCLLPPASAPVSVVFYLTIHCTLPKSEISESSNVV